MSRLDDSAQRNGIFGQFLRNGFPITTVNDHIPRWARPSGGPSMPNNLTGHRLRAGSLHVARRRLGGLHHHCQLESVAARFYGGQALQRQPTFPHAVPVAPTRF